MPWSCMWRSQVLPHIGYQHGHLCGMDFHSSNSGCVGHSGLNGTSKLIPVGLRPGCRAGQSIASLRVFWWKSVTNALCVAILEDSIQSHTVPLSSPVVAESHLNMSLRWQWSQASFFQRGRCRPTPSHCLHQIRSYTINTAFSVSSIYCRRQNLDSFVIWNAYK